MRHTRVQNTVRTQASSVGSLRKLLINRFTITSFCDRKASMSLASPLQIGCGLIADPGWLAIFRAKLVHKMRHFGVVRHYHRHPKPHISSISAGFIRRHPGHPFLQYCDSEVVGEVLQVTLVVVLIKIATSPASAFFFGGCGADMAENGLHCGGSAQRHQCQNQQNWQGCRNPHSPGSHPPLKWKMPVREVRHFYFFPAACCASYSFQNCSAVLSGRLVCWFDP